MPTPSYIKKLARQQAQPIMTVINQVKETAVVNARQLSYLSEYKGMTLREILTVMDKGNGFLVHLTDDEITEILARDDREL